MTDLKGKKASNGGMTPARPIAISDRYSVASTTHGERGGFRGSRGSNSCGQFEALSGPAALFTPPFPLLEATPDLDLQSNDEQLEQLGKQLTKQSWRKVAAR